MLKQLFLTPELCCCSLCMIIKMRYLMMNKFHKTKTSKRDTILLI